MVALTGNQKAEEESVCGIRFPSPIPEGVCPLLEPAPLGSSFPLSPRAGSSPIADSPRVLHHPCRVPLTLPIPANKLFMNMSLETLAGALTDPVTVYLISF